MLWYIWTFSADYLKELTKYWKFIPHNWQCISKCYNMQLTSFWKLYVCPVTVISFCNSSASSCLFLTWPFTWSCVYWLRIYCRYIVIGITVESDREWRQLHMFADERTNIGSTQSSRRYDQNSPKHSTIMLVPSVNWILLEMGFKLSI